MYVLLEIGARGTTAISIDYIIVLDITQLKYYIYYCYYKRSVVVFTYSLKYYMIQYITIYNSS